MLKANSVVITKVMTMKVVDKLVESKFCVQLSPVLSVGDASAGLSRATSSLPLSSSIVILDGDGRRLCASVGLRLGHMILEERGNRRNRVFFKGTIPEVFQSRFLLDD